MSEKQERLENLLNVAEGDADHWRAQTEAAWQERDEAHAERDRAVEDLKAERHRRIEMTRLGEDGQLSGWRNRAESAESDAASLRERVAAAERLAKEINAPGPVDEAKMARIYNLAGEFWGTSGGASDGTE